MKSKDRVLRQFLADFDQLFAVAENYPPPLADEPGVCGDWSAREVIAHLSGWLVKALERYDEFEAGDTRNMHYDLDAFNAQSVAERAGQDWAATLGELYGLVDVFRFRVLRLKPDQVANDPRYLEWVSTMAEDCRQHTEELEAFLRERSL